MGKKDTGDHRVQHPKPAGGAVKGLLALNYLTGETDHRYSCDKDKWDRAVEEKREKLFVAGDLSDIDSSHLKDVQYIVPVEVKSEWYQQEKYVIDEKIVPASGSSSVASFKSTLVGDDAVRRNSHRKVADVCAGLHWQFIGTHPQKYQIILFGKTFEKRVPIPLGVGALGVNYTVNDTLTVTVTPEDIQLLEDSSTSAWRSSHDMKIRWSIAMEGRNLAQIFFRYRIQAAGMDTYKHRLRLEMLVLPHGTKMESFSAAAAKVINGPNFPAIPVMTKWHPIQWDSDGYRHMTHIFTDPLIEVISEKNPPDQVLQEDLPNITDPLLRRLLWEVESKFAAGIERKDMAEFQRNFVLTLSKNPSHHIKYSTPTFKIAGQQMPPQQEPHWSDHTTNTSPASSQSSSDSDSKRSAKKKRLHASSSEGEKEPAKKKRRRSSVASPGGENEASGVAADEKRDWDFTQSKTPPNADHKIPAKGKRLLKAPLLTGSRYTDYVRPAPSALSALALAHPRATEEDVLHMHQLLSSSLAKSSRANVRSASNAFDRVFGPLWQVDPQVGDQEVLLSRLLRMTSISRSTALQYMKLYGTALQLIGKPVPAETQTFIRMKRGVRKSMMDPVKDAAEEHRKAYNITSLELAVRAFDDMVVHGHWSYLRALMWKTVLLVSFWGRFRLGELCVPSQNNILIEDTVLLIDVDLVEDEEKNHIVRIWLRREKAASHRAGSLVEMPMLPENLKHLCPYRTMEMYILFSKAVGLTDFDPLFTDPSGSAMTPGKFAAGVEVAISTIYPGLGQDLFKLLKNHSTRAAIPTLCQELAVHIPTEILQNLGRWQSNAYLVYLKSYGAALRARRYIEDKIIKKVSESRNKGLI